MNLLFACIAINLLVCSAQTSTTPTPTPGPSDPPLYQSGWLWFTVVLILLVIVLGSLVAVVVIKRRNAAKQINTEEIEPLTQPHASQSMMGYDALTHKPMISMPIMPHRHTTYPLYNPC